MKISVLNLTGGGISGGHKKYLVNMLPRLAASEKIKKILCASPPALGAETWLPASPKTTFAECESFRMFGPSPGALFRKTLDEFKPDLVFVSIERHIDYDGAPVATIVQNMAPLAQIRTTRGVLEKLQSLARRFEAKAAARRAKAVIAPTEFVRETLVGALGIENEKIAVIPFGCNQPPDPIKPPEKALAEALKSGFIFTAGSFEVYRGFEDLLRTMAELKKIFPALKLAVAGGARKGTYAYRRDLEKLALDLGLSDNILWLGSLPEENLSWFYSNCLAFVITSKVESFCFVALEALAHGCNCVSTDSPCLPEIFSGCALYYKAGDAAGLSKGVLEVLRRSPAEKDRAAFLARQRAGIFSWDMAAQKTVEVFERTAGRRP